MKRPNEYIITSHKQRKQEDHSTPVCARQKRRHVDIYESQHSPKKPNLDIKTGKT